MLPVSQVQVILRLALAPLNVLSLASADQPEKVVAEVSETIKLVPGRNKKSWTLAISEARYW